MICYYSLVGVILLYTFFDVSYFLRMAFTICWGRLFHKRKSIFEKTVHYGICLTTDIDIFLKHMNNARYVRELDFARSYYYDRSGIFTEIVRKGGSAVQGATSIRYRRPIPVFATYKITTQLVFWENRNIFLEHNFITLSDDFVRATVLSKQSVTGISVPVSDIIQEIEPGARKPVLPEELRLWLDCLDESSLRFKRMRNREPEDKTEISIFLPNPPQQ